MPEVSVIVPTYNRDYIIKETVDSILAQTFEDFEVLVVDDGSTDDTRAVVENSVDNRVRYFHKTNGGPSSARNFGLSKAKGRYILFLDSDDYWPENYLEIMRSELKDKSEFGAAYSLITVVYSDGAKIESYKRPEGKSGRITNDLFKRGFIWPSAAIFRASVWKDFYFDESLARTSEDSDAFLRLSMLTQLLFVPEVQAFHRMSSDSISTDEGVACSRMLSLERFYFKLGGDRIVPTKTARRRLSHACRKVAEDRRSKMEKAAALKLYMHAIRYWPRDLRLYTGLFKTLLLDKSKDPKPDWEMPGPLGDPVGTNRFA
ncbi:MAG: glycosyltransferase family 2 protein [Planctomycetota bacterium]|nr:glycosyltransferase family 2 protein [Planctomycetota bacterium]